jgi:hypothetical protein
MDFNFNQVKVSISFKTIILCNSWISLLKKRENHSIVFSKNPQILQMKNWCNHILNQSSIKTKNLQPTKPFTLTSSILKRSTNCTRSNTSAHSWKISMKIPSSMTKITQWMTELCRVNQSLVNSWLLLTESKTVTFLETIPTNRGMMWHPSLKTLTLNEKVVSV